MGGHHYKCQERKSDVKNDDVNTDAHEQNSIMEIVLNEEVSQVSKLSFLFFYQISVWLSDPSLDQRPIGTKSNTKIQGSMLGKQVGFNSWLFSI